MSAAKAFPSVLMFDAAYPPPVVGGKEKQAHLLSKALISSGTNVHVFSYVHNDNGSELYEGVRVKRFSPGIRSVVPLFFGLLKKRKEFEILHIHTPSRVGKVVALFGFLLGYTVVFKMPGQNLLDNKRSISILVWKAIFRMVSLIVVLEKDTYEKVIQLGVDTKKIFFTTNGVEVPERLCAVAPGKIAKLLFVGRLVPVKLCDQLIYACDILRNQGLEFRLTIVGSGPLEEDLRNLVAELSLEELIIFEGQKPDVFRYMKESDILILPSASEGMSNVLLEAMSVGLAVITTEVGSAKLVVGPRGEKFLCPPFNPQCLAKQICKLASHFELRTQYRTYLHERCRNEFSIDIVAERYKKKYDEILNN